MKVDAAAILAGSALNISKHNGTCTLDLQPHYYNGTVEIKHLSVPGNLDGFKLQTSAAPSSADFWYFDVFSQSTKQTLNIVFFNSGDFAQYPHPLALQVSGVYENGTDFYFEAMADDGVHLVNGPDGVTGDWGMARFSGSPLDKPNIRYSISIDSPEMDIKGTIDFQSVAPARYPCALNGASGATQNLLPGLYWANAVPDAVTNVDLMIGGTSMQFSDGVGYHDKNWGNQSIIDGPRYWDWGHARFGPYSVVWYNLLDYYGQESRRAYVAKNGEVLLLSCDMDSLEVRQMGGKAAWPPTTGLHDTDGLSVRFTLPDGQILALNVTTEFIVRDERGAYQRANGHIVGGVEGQETHEGRGHYEEFIFGIVNDYTPPYLRD